MSRARGRGHPALVIATLGLLLAACVERDAPPTTRATPSPTSTPTVRATAAAGTRLPDADIVALMRRAVCWYDDPALARTCLPPQPASLDAIEQMGRSGDLRLVAPLVDMLWLDIGWRPQVDAALVRLTGEQRPDPRAWNESLAARRPPLAPDYARWKARLLALTSTKDTQPPYERLITDALTAHGVEQLVWSGVQPNASRPLTDPPTVRGQNQRYLDASDVVYGVVVAGLPRAYPQRVIAWHGVVNDSLGGGPFVVAYCLPCGGAVAFERAKIDDATPTFGTSGLARGSRTLMFDNQLHRLWDMLRGEALGEPKLALPHIPVFTTTWADWHARHPDTTVLDLNTGIVRDYAEGVATRDDRASALPLYPVANVSAKLPTKEPVLGVHIGTASRAYAVAEVHSRKLIQERVGEESVVVVSEGPGLAAGAYRAEGVAFARVEGAGLDLVLVDDAGGRWSMREYALVNTRDRRELRALPWRQTYWFAWQGAYPETSVWAD